MNLSKNQNAPDSDEKKAPSSSRSNEQPPIGITPQTPQDEDALNQRIKDGSPLKLPEEDVSSAPGVDHGTLPHHSTNDRLDASKSIIDSAQAVASTNLDDNIKNSESNNVDEPLSSSIDNVNLEHSLGPLDPDATPRPAKRPRLHPNDSASREKQNRNMKSAADALKPNFRNESVSVNEENVPSGSFDVANDDLVGGSSSIVNIKNSSKNSQDEKELQTSENEMKRINAAAEEEINAAIMATNMLDEDEVETPKAGPSPPKLQSSKSIKPQTQITRGNVLDFDKSHPIKSSDNNGHPDVKSDMSSASSFVESYHEDDESRLFPPAPPSTPATAKDVYQPLPFQPHGTTGSLEYSVELKQESEHPTPPSISATPSLPQMPDNSFSYGDDVATPLPDDMTYNAATAETPRAGDETPAVAGDVTERRQGHARKKGPTQLAPKADFELWDVGDRYELKRILGRGSYGEVAQAVDKDAVALQERASSQEQQSQSNLPLHYRNSTYVAVKKISKAFDQEVDAVRLFREMHILRRLRGHDCIIQLIDVVQPRSSDLSLFNDLYLVFEYVDTDLYKLIMSPQYLTTEHIQTFLYQMLVGLKYIHSSSVIHRDLKPAILLNEDCTLKICDFGLARIVHNNKVNPLSAASPRRDDQEEQLSGTSNASSTVPHTPINEMDRDHYKSLPPLGLSRQLTKHVVTRWYRAPELILIQPYASAVDIWSLGCIFAELLSMQEGSVPTYQDRQPLFPGGSCYPLSGETGATSSDEKVDQLSVIFSVIGMPSEEDLKSVGKATEYIKNLAKRQSRSLESLYPAADHTAIDLLRRMLMFNPAKRLTALQALEHDFLVPVRRKDMERFAEEPLVSPTFLDKNRIDLSTLKEETYKEALWYKKSRESSQN